MCEPRMWPVLLTRAHHMASLLCRGMESAAGCPNLPKSAHESSGCPVIHCSPFPSCRPASPVCIVLSTARWSEDPMGTVAPAKGISLSQHPTVRNSVRSLSQRLSVTDVWIHTYHTWSHSHTHVYHIHVHTHIRYTHAHVHLPYTCMCVHIGVCAHVYTHPGTHLHTSRGKQSIVGSSVSDARHCGLHAPGLQHPEALDPTKGLFCCQS